MSEIESLKRKFEHQTERIVNGLKTELNNRNVGGDPYKADCVLNEIKEANCNFLSELKLLTDSPNSTKTGGIQTSQDYFILGDNNDESEGAVVNDNTSIGLVSTGGNVGQSNEEGGDSNDLTMASVNDTKGLMISWGNCKGGKILLTSPSFSFPSMTFPNMLTMWFCGDLSKNIPPYKILRSRDVKHIKGGEQKLSNMKDLVHDVVRAARMGNTNDLIVHDWSPRKVLDLYLGVKHFFSFPCLSSGKRRLETISWKTYLNILMKRKGRLLGEQL